MRQKQYQCKKTLTLRKNHYQCGKKSDLGFLFIPPFPAHNLKTQLPVSQNNKIEPNRHQREEEKKSESRKIQPEDPGRRGRKAKRCGRRRRSPGRRKGVDHVLDSKLDSYFREEICRVLNIGILCTSHLPINRPSMRRIVKQLQEIGGEAQPKTAGKKDVKPTPYYYEDATRIKGV
ncbi:unnamed protein product [Linum trigynum]|uniref:Uncharacterized protein n=1 Tax=Linum trigynum TaxID=586398 RepID=A0AAV2FZ18_9ROSI